jgi:hypothetical protein
MPSIEVPLEHGYTRGEELANTLSAVPACSFVGFPFS